MADKKISELNSAAAVYDADDFALVQDGDTKQVNASAVKAYVKDGLSKSDVGLGNVDNTSDANKPVSTATQTALDLKQDAASAATLTGTQTLTNKTISGSSNTLSNIANSSLTNSSITINGNAVSLGGSTTVSAATTNTLTIGTGLSGTSFNGSAAATIAIDSSVVTLTGTQTLTNKTLTSPVISGGTANNVAIGGTTPAAGAFTTLSSTGNTTIGDASADTLTINGTAVSIPNNLNFDSNTLFIDAANNLVGIGTSSSSGKLTVSGVSSSNVASFLSSASGVFGAISIGRTANEFSLGTVAVSGQFFSGTAAGDSVIAYGAGKLFVGGGNTGSSGTLSTVFDTSGNVGIGTSSPGEKLEVVGVTKTRTSSGSGIQIVPGATPYIQSFGASGNNTLQLNGQSISFWSGASYGAESQKMLLDSSGNFGLGRTTNANYRMVIRGIGTSSSTAGLVVENGVGTETFFLSDAGNLGLGVTPSGWSGGKALEIGYAGNSLWSANGPDMYLSQNAYYSTGWKYGQTGNAPSQLELNGGAFKFFTAPSGTAGAALTFTQVMTLDASGNLLVGDTSGTGGGERLYVKGAASRVLTVKNTTNTSGYSGIAVELGGSNGNNTSTYHFTGSTPGISQWFLYGNGTSSYSSDARQKKDIETARDGYLSDVSKLRIVKYRWLNQDENTPKELGLIAQEVEKIFPGLVQDHELTGVHGTRKVIKHSVMEFIMLKAIQELHAEIELLKAKVN